MSFNNSFGNYNHWNYNKKNKDISLKYVYKKNALEFNCQKKSLFLYVKTDVNIHSDIQSSRVKLIIDNKHKYYFQGLSRNNSLYETSVVLGKYKNDIFNKISNAKKIRIQVASLYNIQDSTYFDISLNNIFFDNMKKLKNECYN